MSSLPSWVPDDVDVSELAPLSVAQLQRLGSVQDDLGVNVAAYRLGVTGQPRGLCSRFQAARLTSRELELLEELAASYGVVLVAYGGERGTVPGSTRPETSADLSGREIAPRGSPMVRVEEGDGLVEAWEVGTDEQTLRRLLETILERWWPHCWFCLLIEGAAWELAADSEPQVSFEDGYLTVHMGSGHFHLCVGDHHGAPDELAARRRTARAELFRRFHDLAPVSWGLRLFNGAGEQQLTVLLPNPLLDRHVGLLTPPRWDRLGAWDELRREFVGLAPDPLDRTATEFAYDPFATGIRP